MKIVGLTGGIGSGKTTVLQCFMDIGTATYIADVEAKKLMNNDDELKFQIKQIFGDKVYKNGNIDRKYLASIVFNDALKLEKLNKLVHPKVQQHFKSFVEKSKNTILIYESAILFESGSNKLCDYIITVVADYETKIKRLKLRDGVSEDEIKARMQHQLNDDYKIAKANFVIENNNIENTKSQISTIYKILQKDDIE
ncbi:MAG: dephospho-CoA kinase [Lutibacter sp.]|uniref:dephospho-CoA kinase n=1 Tax=Lutibacter sp. TaxID=1925666 RepID=UPI00299E04D3|nr:dephospho-CoA kinase [Lutibacter sp.]MDX1828311.1 dephospho-CoA kinase [Lutibacter sp.]